jgi:hypothetical protein
MAIKCANTEFVGKLIKGLIDLHDGTVSMPLQITQKVLQGLIQSGSERPLQSRQSILPHNAAQVAGFPKVKQMPLTYIMPNADRPASQRLAVEFISTASSSTGRLQKIYRNQCLQL